MYDMIVVRTNIIQEMFVIKTYVLKRIKNVNPSMGKDVKIRNSYCVLVENKLQDIRYKKSNFFYRLLVKKTLERSHMESFYSDEFKFENNNRNWTCIYEQKLCFKGFNDLSIFNFKILNNILPCGKSLHRWKTNISKNCDMCKEVESIKHMLYECSHVSQIWLKISNILDFNVKWKTIVCGYIEYTVTDKIFAHNFILSIIAFAIFKENSNCKFYKKVLRTENIIASIKKYLSSYFMIVRNLDMKILLFYINNVFSLL